MGHAESHHQNVDPGEHKEGGTLAAFSSLLHFDAKPLRPEFDLTKVHEHRYELQFGFRNLRCNGEFMAAAIEDDPEGTMYAMHYCARSLLEDAAWLRRGRAAAAAAYTALGESEKRAVMFSEYGSLNEALHDGGSLLVDGAWLVHCAFGGGGAARGVLPRRQDLPNEAVFQGPVWDKVKVLAVSHTWASPEHPDPLGERLRDVARLVAWVLETHPGCAVAVFWDFCSLPQHAVEYSPGTARAVKLRTDRRARRVAAGSEAYEEVRAVPRWQIARRSGFLQLPAVGATPTLGVTPRPPPPTHTTPPRLFFVCSSFSFCSSSTLHLPVGDGCRPPPPPRRRWTLPLTTTATTASCPRPSAPDTSCATPRPPASRHGERAGTRTHSAASLARFCFVAMSAPKSRCCSVCRGGGGSPPRPGR